MGLWVLLKRVQLEIVWAFLYNHVEISVLASDHWSLRWPLSGDVVLSGFVVFSTIAAVNNLLFLSPSTLLPFPLLSLSLSLSLFPKDLWHNFGRVQFIEKCSTLDPTLLMRRGHGSNCLVIRKRVERERLDTTDYGFTHSVHFSLSNMPTHGH